MRLLKRPGRRTLFLLSIAVVVLIVLSGVTELLLYKARSKREQTEEYREMAADDWKKTVESMLPKIWQGSSEPQTQ